MVRQTYADNVDANGKVFKTIGDNIRMGARAGELIDFSTITDKLDALDPEISALQADTVENAKDIKKNSYDISALKEDIGDFFFKTETANKFNKLSVDKDIYYKNVDGTVTKASSTGYVAFLLPVKGGKTYTVSGTSYSVLSVGNNMEYLGYTWKSGETTFNTDLLSRKTELKYLAISFRTSSYPVDTYMAVEGDALPEEYVPYSVHKEIKEDVEIDYSQIINKPNHEKKYYVGTGKEYTSFTECIKIRLYMLMEGFMIFSKK